MQISIDEVIDTTKSLQDRLDTLVGDIIAHYDRDSKYQSLENYFVNAFQRLNKTAFQRQQIMETVGCALIRESRD